MKLRFPRPLGPGDTVAVTSSSGGVSPASKPKLEFTVETMRSRGFEALIDGYVGGNRVTSVSAREHMRELQDFPLSLEIRAVVPPWGSELAISLISCLDWKRLAEAKPTWVVSYSDISTPLLPLALNAGVTTVHGSNPLDTPFAVPEGLVGWMDIASFPQGASFTQGAPDKCREGYVLYETLPEAIELEPAEEAYRAQLDGAGDVHVRDKFVNGCVGTLGDPTGTPLSRAFELTRSTGSLLITYAEAANTGTYKMCRTLHGMRLVDFFRCAAAVLVGRTSASDCTSMNQYDTVIDALGGLGVSIVTDVGCGHVAPSMPFVGSAAAEIAATGTQSRIRQALAWDSEPTKQDDALLYHFDICGYGELNWTDAVSRTGGQSGEPPHVPLEKAQPSRYSHMRERRTVGKQPEEFVFDGILALRRGKPDGRTTVDVYDQLSNKRDPVLVQHVDIVAPRDDRLITFDLSGHGNHQGGKALNFMAAGPEVRAFAQLARSQLAEAGLLTGSIDPTSPRAARPLRRSSAFG